MGDDDGRETSQDPGCGSNLGKASANSRLWSRPNSSLHPEPLAPSELEHSGSLENVVTKYCLSCSFINILNLA